MKSLSLALAGLALVSASALAEDCTAPEVPSIPDGGASTYDQMVEGMGAVKAFQEANSAYMSCIEPKLAAATEAAKADGASDIEKAAAQALNEVYNAAVTAEEELAGAFNTEIREFKAANPGS